MTQAESNSLCFLFPVVASLFWGSVLLLAPEAKLPIALAVQQQVSLNCFIVKYAVTESQCSKHTAISQQEGTGEIFPLCSSLEQKNVLYVPFISVCIFSVSTRQQHEKVYIFAAGSRGLFQLCVISSQSPSVLWWLWIRPQGKMFLPYSKLGSPAVSQPNPGPHIPCVKDVLAALQEQKH